ncbi:hypothetical protein GDO81_006221 [Engystomops pustulosus]|uniref:Uncharacterized protein n=1 Tax=Engystomops pustulosus TaxID=76066 RepID=A0AAV7CVY8_ENGPU|nr:hypothetical protein GDO81_006221 [Engystomops pustulosus]KAG8589032.1 hypothetical protein GDO81_006221 [Engystomops pustulosus]
MGPGLLHDPYVDMTSHLFLLHIRSALCHSRWSGMGGPLLITPPSDSYSDKRGSGARDMEGYQTIMFGFFHLLTLCTLGSYVTPFRICAFNGQHFGEKKVANDEILNVVVKVRREQRHEIYQVAILCGSVTWCLIPCYLSR